MLSFGHKFSYPYKRFHKWLNNKYSRIKKLVKTLMDFFQKFSILTENLVYIIDVTCSVLKL